MLKTKYLITKQLLLLLLLLKLKYLILVVYSKKLTIRKNLMKLINTKINTKINKIENKITVDHNHDKYITTQEFNKSTSENYAATLAQTNLANKNDTANFVQKTK